jgi:hypothetical protein
MINSNFRCIIQVCKIRPEIHHANVFDKKGMVGIIKTAVHSSSFRQSYIPSNKGVK